jgi:hypothetical protein
MQETVTVLQEGREAIGAQGGSDEGSQVVQSSAGVVVATHKNDWMLERFGLLLGERVDFRARPVDLMQQQTTGEVKMSAGQMCSPGTWRAHPDASRAGTGVPTRH